MTAADAGKVSDVMFKVVERGVFTYEQLASGIGLVAAPAAQAKVGLDQIGAALATMTKTMSADEAITALSRLFDAFTKPTTEMAAALKAAGYESGYMLLQTQGLVGAVKFLEETTGGAGDALAAMGLDIRAMRAATRLTANDSQMFTKDLESMQEAAGATDAALREQSKGGIVQLRAALNSAKGALIEIGGAAAPAIKAFAALARIIGEVLQWILKIPGVGPVFVGLAGAIGLLGLTLGPVLIALPMLVSSLAALAEMGGVGAALAAIRTALAAIIPVKWGSAVASTSLAIAEAEVAAAQTAVAAASAREAASLGVDAGAKAASVAATEALVVAEGRLAVAQAATATRTGILGGLLSRLTGVGAKINGVFTAARGGIAVFGQGLVGLIGPGGLIALVAIAIAGLGLELWNLGKRFGEMRKAISEAKAAKAATREAFAEAGAKGAGIGEAIDLSGRKPRKRPATAAAQPAQRTMTAGMMLDQEPGKIMQENFANIESIIPGPTMQPATVASGFFSEPQAAMAGALDTTKGWVADTNDAVGGVFAGLPAVATGMFGGFQDAVATGMQNMVDRIRGFRDPMQAAMQSVTRIPSVVMPGGGGLAASSTEEQQARAASNDDWRSFGAMAAESFKSVFGVTLESLENGINTAANMMNLTPQMLPAMAGSPGTIQNRQQQPAAMISGDRSTTTIEIDTFGAGLDIANRLPYGRVRY